MFTDAGSQAVQTHMLPGMSQEWQKKRTRSNEKTKQKPNLPVMSEVATFSLLKDPIVLLDILSPPKKNKKQKQKTKTIMEVEDMVQQMNQRKGKKRRSNQNFAGNLKV